MELGKTAIAKTSRLALMHPSLRYIALLSTAVGVDLGSFSNIFLRQFGPLLELQRLAPLGDITMTVPIEIGLISAAIIYTGKTLESINKKKKDSKKKELSPLLKAAIQIPPIVIAAHLLSSGENLNLPTAVLKRKKEPIVRDISSKDRMHAEDAIITMISSMNHLDFVAKQKLTNFYSQPQCLDSILRFANLSFEFSKKPNLLFSEYFSQYFLPTLVNASTSAEIHPYTIAALFHYGYLTNQNKSVHDSDVWQENLRLVFGATDSTAKRKTPGIGVENMLSTIQFLGFPISGLYGGSRVGAMNMIRENNEPTIGWHDLKITELARGILAFLTVTSEDPTIVNLQQQLQINFPESVAAAENLEQSWHEFEKQRIKTARAIDKLVEKIEQEPLLSRLFSSDTHSRDFKAWEDLGFQLNNAPFHTTHLTQTFKYYVEHENTGNVGAEDIVLNSMLDAIDYFASVATHSGIKEAMRQLISSQFEDERFWNGLKVKLPHHKDEIKSVLDESSVLEIFAQSKRNYVSRAYSIFAQEEYNPEWQIAANIGAGIHFSRIMNQFSNLRREALENPAWQQFCVMAVRELSPANLYVKRDKYPLITDIDLTSDAENLLRRMDLMVGKLRKHIVICSSEDLLHYMIHYDIVSDPAGIKQEYEDLFWGSAWSGIKAATMEYELIQK